MEANSSIGRRGRVLGAALIVTLAACGDGGGGGGGSAPPTAPAPPPAPLTLRVPGGSAIAGSAATVVVAGVSLPQEVSGTLAAAPIRFRRWDDTTLVGLVPGDATGSQTLRLEIGGREGQATISIRPGLAIPDPAAAVEAGLDVVSATFAAPAPTGYSAAEWNRSRALADSLVRAIRSGMASATPAQRLAAARVLARRSASASASLAPGAFLAPSAAALPPAAPNRCTPLADRASASLIDLGMELKDVAVSLVDPSDRLQDAVTQLGYLDQMTTTITTLALLPLECAKLEILEVEAQDSEVFENGKSVGVRVMEVVRALSSADARDAFVSRITDQVEDLHARAQGLASAVPSLFEKLPTRLTALPAQEPIRRALEPDYLRVVGVTPSTVSLSASGGDGEIALTATTTATVETPFTATLAHTADPSVQVKVEGTVRPAAPVRVTVSPDTATITGLQKELKLTATVTGASDTSVRWSSSDLRVAAVGADGTVLSRDVGTVTIRATSVADSTQSATATVRVVSGIGITISPDSAALVVGETFRFRATLTGTNSEGVVWSSSDEAIATVDATGTVTAKAVGRATITATAAYDLTVSDSVAVTVTPPPAGNVRLSPVKTSFTGVIGSSGGLKTLQCKMEWTASIPAGESGSWTGVPYVGTLEGGKTFSGNMALTSSFTAGTRTFSANWTSQGLSEAPEFTIVLHHTYTNGAGQAQATAPITMKCARPSETPPPTTPPTTPPPGGAGSCQSLWGPILPGTWRATSMVDQQGYQHLRGGPGSPRPGDGQWHSWTTEFGSDTYRTTRTGTGDHTVFSGSYTIVSQPETNEVSGLRCGLELKDDRWTYADHVRSYSNGVLVLRRVYSATNWMEISYVKQ